MTDSTARRQGYQWAAPGDINAFFGLMLDNVTGLLFLVGLLVGVFDFPKEFVVSAMVPGTALGVLIGDLAFFYVAFRLARKTGRSDVTAMPLGLDTPSTFGFVLFILGPSYAQGIGLGLDETAAAYRTWHIGIWCVVLSGLLKLALAPLAQWVRRTIPRAGLLGSLAAIALVLISFIPLMHIFAHPLPGMLALAIVLTTLIAKVPLPGRTPGTLGALLVAGLVYYMMCGFGAPGYHFPSPTPIQWMPTQWLEAWRFEWVHSFAAAVAYLPIAFPFAIATVVGGIDCTESAAAAGDDYDTRTVIGVEGLATLLAGLSGGVIQTTPYIGHPAYKAMGGRAAYTLGTALLIGSAGLLGYFQLLNEWIPLAVVMPILVFVGVEITAQSFAATPKRHYPAVAIACLPALAVLALNFPNQMLGDSTMTNAYLVEASALEGGLTADQMQAGVDVEQVSRGIGLDDLANESLRRDLNTLRMLASGFILTSLFWAWALAASIDRKLKTAAAVMFAAAVCTLLGVIHSPLPGNQIFLPYGPDSWGSIVLDPSSRPLVFEYAAGYALTALLFWAWAPRVQAASDD